MDRKQEIIYGFHPVFEALKAGRRNFSEVFIAKGKNSKRLKTVVSVAKSLNIPLSFIDPLKIQSLSRSEKHQRVCAITTTYPYVELSYIMDKRKKKDGPIVLLCLDSLSDPSNLGALVRTALCFGIDGIVIPKDRSVSPTPSVSKASAGALEHSYIARVTNLAATLEEMKSWGLWVGGMDRFARQSIFSTKFSGPLAIVVGSEKKGIRTLVKKSCDFLFSIPQQSQVDSLNASMAGSIAMYEIFRQRDKI